MKAGDERETPQWLFDLLDSRFAFTLDVAASSDNAKCVHYLTKEVDGLSKDWTGYRCFMNPPWGRGQLEKWCRKAYEQSLAGTLVVGIVPHDTSTQWWNWCCGGSTFLWLPRRRIHFPTPGEKKGSPTFPVVIVVWHGFPHGVWLNDYIKKTKSKT